MSSNHQVTTKKINITAKQHTVDIETNISPLLRGNFGPKYEIYSQYYEIWHSEKVKFVNHKYDIWNCRS